MSSKSENPLKIIRTCDVFCREQLSSQVDQLRVRLAESQQSLQSSTAELQQLQTQHDTLLERHNKILQENVTKEAELRERWLYLFIFFNSVLSENWFLLRLIESNIFLYVCKLCLSPLSLSPGFYRCSRTTWPYGPTCPKLKWICPPRSRPSGRPIGNS